MPISARKTVVRTACAAAACGFLLCPPRGLAVEKDAPASSEFADEFDSLARWDGGRKTGDPTMSMEAKDGVATFRCPDGHGHGYTSRRFRVPEIDERPVLEVKVTEAEPRGKPGLAHLEVFREGDKKGKTILEIDSPGTYRVNYKQATGWETCGGSVTVYIVVSSQSKVTLDYLRFTKSQPEAFTR